MTTDELINQKDVWLLAGASAERERILKFIKTHSSVSGNYHYFSIKDLIAEIKKGVKE